MQATAGARGQDQVQDQDAFERMEKALREMSAALQRLEIIGADNSLDDAAALIEFQARSEDMLERLRIALGHKAKSKGMKGNAV